MRARHRLSVLPTLVHAIAGTGAVSPLLCTPVRPACPGPGQNMGARGTHPSPCRDSRDRPSEAIDTGDEEEGYGTEAFRAPPVCYGHARPGRALVSSRVSIAERVIRPARRSGVPRCCVPGTGVLPGGMQACSSE